MKLALNHVLIGSFVSVALAGIGIAAHGGSNAGEDKGAAPAPSCGTDKGCEATARCDGDSCVITCTDAEGRTCEIELACRDGKCEVLRCEPCDGSAATSCGTSCAK